MMNELMLFISKSRVSALDLSGSIDLDWISLEGEVNLRYSQEEDLKQFVGYIKEYYNIETFSEINLHVKIISFDAVRNNVDYLYQQMRNAIDVNIIDAKNIIPLLLLKETTVQKDMKYQVSVYDTDYCVVVDDQLRCECTVSEKARESICFELEKFALFSRFDCRNLMGDEKKYQELKKEMESRYAVEKAISTEQYQLLLKEKNKYIAEIARLKQDLQQSENKLADILNEKLVSRVVYKFHGGFVSENTRMKLKHCFEKTFNDGVLVKKGAEIASIIHRVDASNFYKRLDLGTDFIVAQNEGRIFYLCNPGDEVVKNQNIAIIGHKTDTKKEIMEWYENYYKK